MPKPWCSGAAARPGERCHEIDSCSALGVGGRGVWRGGGKGRTTGGSGRTTGGRGGGGPDGGRGKGRAAEERRRGG